MNPCETISSISFSSNYLVAGSSRYTTLWMCLSSFVELASGPMRISSAISPVAFHNDTYCYLNNMSQPCSGDARIR